MKDPTRARKQGTRRGRTQGLKKKPRILRSQKPKPLDSLAPDDLLRLMNEEDQRVAPAVGRVIPRIAAAVRAAVDGLRRGGRLIYVGAGTSGRLGLLDALEVPPTFGVTDKVLALVAGGIRSTVEETSSLEDDQALGRREVAELHIEPADVVVGIAASGTTPYTLGAIEEARRRGAQTVAVTTVRGSPLASLAEIAIIPEVGDEILRGSTRLKAGTAQKLVLNMLSTATMVQLGHVYDDLMVGVRPLNEKLRRRVRDLVARVTGRSEEGAAALLDAAGGETKVALVMGLAGVGAAEARSLLEESGGFVRAAVDRAST